MPVAARRGMRRGMHAGQPVRRRLRVRRLRVTDSDSESEVLPVTAADVREWIEEHRRICVLSAWKALSMTARKRPMLRRWKAA